MLNKDVDKTVQIVASPGWWALYGRPGEYTVSAIGAFALMSDGSVEPVDMEGDFFDGHPATSMDNFIRTMYSPDHRPTPEEILAL